MSSGGAFAGRGRLELLRAGEALLCGHRPDWRGKARDRETQRERNKRDRHKQNTSRLYFWEWRGKELSRVCILEGEEW